VTSIHINYIILSVAIVFEAYPWKMAYEEFNARRGEKSIVEAVHDSKDPSLFAILFEDTAAILGLVVALVGLFIGDYFGIPEADGIASVLIGLILASTASLLAYECKSLLIGEAADPSVVRNIGDLFNGHPHVDNVNEVLTMHMGPNDVLLNLSLDFKNNITAGDIESVVSEFEQKIKKMHPEIKRVFIEAQSRHGHMMNTGLK
jgi:divalent metal cation (Fe/Co/Zn/Cd) transporter